MQTLERLPAEEKARFFATYSSSQWADQRTKFVNSAVTKDVALYRYNESTIKGFLADAYKTHLKTICNYTDKKVNEIMTDITDDSKKMQTTRAGDYTHNPF